MTITTNVVFHVGKVLGVEKVVRQKHVNGAAKDAVFEEEIVGHKVQLNNGTSLVFPVSSRPEVSRGDDVFVEFRTGEKS